MSDSEDYTTEALLERLDNMTVDKLRFTLKAILIAGKMDRVTFLKTLDLSDTICQATEIWGE